MGEQRLKKHVTDEDDRNTRSVWKGLLAGAIGGIAAIAAKSAAERFYPQHCHDNPDLDQAQSANIPERATLIMTGPRAQKAIHWSVGLAACAAYGAVAEYFPEATTKKGASFGLMMMGLSHETGRHSELAADGYTGEAANFVVFGVVAEQVRRIVRHVL